MLYISLYHIYIYIYISHIHVGAVCPGLALDHGISDLSVHLNYVVGHFEWTLVDIHWWTLGGGHGGHSLVDKSELLVRHLVDT